MLTTAAFLLVLSASTPTANTTAVNPDEVVCRRVQGDVGTRIAAPRVCRTRADWAQEEAEAREQLRRRGERASGN